MQLKADSHHPLPLKKSLPYDQLCRVKRICTKHFERNTAMMVLKCKARDYKKNILEDAKFKIAQKNRSDFLKPRSKKKTNFIVFSTKYTKSVAQFKGI